MPGVSRSLKAKRVCDNVRVAIAIGHPGCDVINFVCPRPNIAVVMSQDFVCRRRLIRHTLRRNAGGNGARHTQRRVRRSP